MIAQALEHRGFKVYKTLKRVEGRCKDTGLYICGFYWRSAVKETDNHPAMQASWRFDLAMADCFSLRDLKSAMVEARRVRKLLPRCRVAWKAFTSSRSDRRWTDYRSFVATLFLRQDPEDE